MSKAKDYFRPLGDELSAHRMSNELAEIDFSTDVTSAEATGATVAVSFWKRSPGTNWAEAETGDFADPTPTVDTDVPSVRFWVNSKADLGPGTYGVRVDLTLSDGRELVSDHPLEMRGSVS